MEQYRALGRSFEELLEDRRGHLRAERYSAAVGKIVELMVRV